MNFTLRFAAVGVLVMGTLILGMMGCGDEKTNPLSPFQPEIINNPDAFEFQITDAADVTTTVFYRWSNSGTLASVDHSTATTAGSATLVIFDADSTQVYTSPFLASGTQTTASGTAGLWTIKAVFNNFGGTANFRVQKQ